MIFASKSFGTGCIPSTFTATSTDFVDHSITYSTKNDGSTVSGVAYNTDSRTLTAITTAPTVETIVNFFGNKCSTGSEIQNQPSTPAVYDYLVGEGAKVHSVTGWSVTPTCADAFKFTLKYKDGANLVFTMPSIITNTLGGNNKVDFTVNTADKAEAGKI